MTSNYSMCMPNCNFHTSWRQEWLDHVPVGLRGVQVPTSWQDRQDCLAKSPSSRTWTLPYLVKSHNKSNCGEAKLLEGQATYISVNSPSSTCLKPSSPCRPQTKVKIKPCHKSQTHMDTSQGHTRARTCPRESHTHPARQREMDKGGRGRRKREIDSKVPKNQNFF